MLSIILLLLSLTTCALRNPIGMTFGHTALDPLLRKLSIILLMAIIDKTNFSQPRTAGITSTLRATICCSFCR